MKKYKDFLILIIFTMGTQALIYFLLKCFITDYNELHSVISFPLIRPFIYIYNFWYPFILFTAFIIYKADKKVFRCLIATLLLGALLAHITFIVYPSILPRPAIEVNNITDWFLNFTYEHDKPVNCFPSVHCLYCFICMFYIIMCKNIDFKKRLPILIFLFIIVLSTFFVIQHIIEDALLSLIYAIIVTFIVRLNKEKIDKFFEKLPIN